MKFRPLIVETRDRSASGSGELYCIITNYVVSLGYCEGCQFYAEVIKRGDHYGVNCSFTHEAPCMHDECEEKGTLCYLWDSEEGRYVYEYYCAEHAHDYGYCYMCGGFWGGCEDFDFAPSKMCSDCRAEYLDEDYDDEAGYVDMPF